MAPSSFLALLSFALVAFLAASFVTPANAVSLHGENAIRSNHHSDIARRKTTKRSKRTCKAPSSSSLSSLSSSTKTSSTTSSTKTTTSTAAAKTTTSSKTTAKTTTTAAPAKDTPKAPSSGGNSNAPSNNSGGSGSGPVKLNGKACLAWPNYNFNNLATWQGSNTGLIYSWDATKVPDAEKYGFTYAPMLWGWDNAADFKSKAVKGYANIALGMNECNEQGQSNMDPYSAISLWRQYMMPLASQGYTLISPAMSSRPNGKDWMKTFMSQCGSDCAVSGIATHYYGTDLDEFKAYVQYWHDTYNLPVYVTEFADQDFNGGPQATMDEIWAFMTAATAWLDQQDWVHAYCWFGAMEGMTNVNPLNKLMNSAGTGPNALGSYFINH